MIMLGRFFRGLLAAIAGLLFLLATPVALAQTSPTPTVTPTPAASPNTPPSPTAEQTTPPTQTSGSRAEQASPASPQPSPGRRGKTYEQPPDPYNMEAIEAYDQEIYGAGR